VCLRRIFGRKRDEVMGEWRKLHSEVLHKLYYSTDIIRQKSVQGFGGLARRKEPTWNTKAYVRGWDQNGFCGDWLGGVGVDWI
jgi:hypothetical protein